mmetsp:Transcript_10047/g.19707  ORF Transcript_10047/g.19707 Transcript_10047/m.19707 type:complete len:170 (-) Transcript_10047:322-831(-)|eukprot:CAMPEP_0171499970 /NCGR_PEP_ID=MMETSP0958-20121227/8722_1 /TAXON_ID=87120 /ORGANISM="Aurantiochytrium limacinum, Strain ATCCMYA-1381" /LENGTH=169 /DNA_ID=CAMNT_0012034581 /DNA_START=160 /DNA_END=669 /DNA_ORIENTATION=+
MLGRTGVVSRQFAARSFDFAKMASKLKSPSAKSELSQLRGLFEDYKKQAEAASKPVEPIDWESYKKSAKMSKDLVAEMEKEYKNISYPEYEDKMAGEIEATLKSVVESASSEMEKSKKRVAELEAYLAKLEGTRTTEDTTFEEVAKAYPALDAEIKEEIKKEEYFKDTK